MKRNPSLRLSAISLHLINIRVLNSIIFLFLCTTFSLISKKAVGERKKRSQHKNEKNKKINKARWVQKNKVLSKNENVFDEAAKNRIVQKYFYIFIFIRKSGFACASRSPELSKETIYKFMATLRDLWIEI